MNSEQLTSPAVHILLLAPSKTPIGGYKVAYEYANALVDLGIAVTVWHSEAFSVAYGSRRRTPRAVKSLLAWWLRGHRADWGKNGVTWFDLDPRVTVRATGWFPRIGLASGDAVIATAVQTMSFAGRLADRRHARSAALIQHYETWAAAPEAIASAWSAVDERIVIAPWLAEKCAELGLDSHLVPNALVAESFPPGPSLDQRPRRVLSLLAPHRYKRPDVVIATLSRVLERDPAAELYTFGQSLDRPDMPASIRYVADPSPTRLSHLYRTCRVYLCGSDEEGWHLPPAEATLSGASVVSTDIGGVRASMNDDALYAPRGDADGLAEQILVALDNTEDSQQRVERARTRILGTTYAGNAQEIRRILGV
ncbi:glycosyltransferase family 4 protein [Microbacterium sp. nov. GSS16]|uniref:glycosyltransferase family 4 protein n=1 Tax=Microbacterium sp. nov. GSS16 TaxID=3019890 RepID=UPI002305DECF|nr:glycosyltransferase family 4 protein [Microbacterium sp. nov. GSS16]WCD92543.1 glycosyltransferase family 4 protein [Microbacterium sp. nov. GSS16]